jgi:hypothetical protein
MTSALFQAAEILLSTTQRSRSGAVKSGRFIFRFRTWIWCRRAKFSKKSC